MAKKYRYAKAAPCVQAVIFARVSTKEQEPGVSLKAQKEAMEDYCNKKGLPIVQKYKAVESSTNGKRTNTLSLHDALPIFCKKAETQNRDCCPLY